MFVCLNNDSSIGISQVGWHWEINGYQDCQTVTLTGGINRDHMLLEKNDHSSKNQNANIIKNFLLYSKILSETPVLTSNKLYTDNSNH